MANTRKAAKRAKQATVRQARNTVVRSATRTALRGALDALKKQDAQLAKDAFAVAVKSIAKAASKGAMPKGRAARKISRLTKFAAKSLPAALK